MLDSRMGIKGKPRKQPHESGQGKRKASDAKPLGGAGGKPSRKLYKAIFAFLLLAALLALVVYSLAVAAIVCRIRDWKQRQKLAAEPTPEAGGDRSNDTSSDKGNSQDTGACHVNLSPFRQLLSASTVAIIIVNSVAALVLLESLMLLPIVNACGRPPAADGTPTKPRAFSVTSDESERAGRDWASASSGGTARDSEAVRTTTATAFALSDMEPCQQHTNNFILRLTYKTRCRDHLVIRVRLPTTKPASSSWPGFPQSCGIAEVKELPSEAEAELVRGAEDSTRSEGESNIAAPEVANRKGGINRGSGKMQEPGVARLINPSVRWMTGTDVQRVNETETGSCERRAPRKSRAIH